MVQNKVVAFMSNRFDSIMALLSAKKDDFTEKTGFNKDFGEGSTNVARGNHNHDSLYEPKNSSITSHLGQTSGNPHGVTKSDVGLSNADNTADLDKVVSNPTIAFVTGEVSPLQQSIANIEQVLASDDTTLDEFQEIVTFIKANKTDLDNLSVGNIAGLNSALAGKKDDFSENSAFNKNFGAGSSDIARGNHSHDASYEAKNTNIQQHISTVGGNPHNVTKNDVGLGNVDNTSDLNKPLSILQKTYIDGLSPLEKEFEIQGGGDTYFNDSGGISSTSSGRWHQGIISKNKYNGDVSFSFTPNSDNGLPRIMVGFTTQNLSLGYDSIEACFYVTNSSLIRWFPSPTSTIVIEGDADWENKDTITITLSGNMVSCHVSGRLVERIDMGNVFDNGAYIKIIPLNTNSSVDLIRIAPHVGTKNLIHSDTYTSRKTIYSTSAVDICTFDPMLISPNKGLNVSLSVPCRSNTRSWGGAYLGLLFQVNGAGDWYNLGNPGHDGGVMNYSAKSVATANLEYVLPIPEHMPALANKAFRITFKLIGRSYNSITTINGSHDINRTANNLGQGTALPWARIQNYTHLIVKEYDI